MICDYCMGGVVAENLRVIPCPQCGGTGEMPSTHHTAVDGSTELADDWDDMEIGNNRIAEQLLAFICPAGLPHTGDDPTQDHGHTQCFWIGLAIQRLREP